MHQKNPSQEGFLKLLAMSEVEAAPGVGCLPAVRNPCLGLKNKFVF
ncbi:hypothetical protein KKB43_06570 [Patescibacteria group bacterium]|nr:hypothetical protein [Patescibacteria group bacterium]MBU4580644.1 hypothetical protein [Patescibacteria group bacterium]MCG2690914.1 hypothetical protein [Candidatus Parcubacteria bacterium]